MRRVPGQQCRRNKAGVTLIELILALAIFSILVLTFMSVFSGVFLGVVRSGNQAQAYHQAQADIESQVGEDFGFYTGDQDQFNLNFDGSEIKVYNWKIESHQEVKNAGSMLSTYIPVFPAIEISPAIFFEGETLPVINVTGHGTSFSNNTKVEIQDMNGNIIYDDTYIAVNADNEIQAQFSIPSDLTLPSGNYIFHTKTILDDNRIEISRARFVVTLPLIVIAGDNNIYIADDALHLKKPVNPPASGSIWTSVSHSGKYYMVSDSAGRIYTQQLFTDQWKMQYANPSFNIYNSTYVPYWSSYIITGNKPSLFRWSDSSYNYVSFSDVTFLKIHDFAHLLFDDGTPGIFVAGNNGTLAYSTDSTLSSSIHSTEINLAQTDPEAPIPESVFDIQSIATGNIGLDSYLVVAGTDGQLSYAQITKDSLDTIETQLLGNLMKYDPSEPGRTINKVRYFNNHFIAVGDQGLLLMSSDLQTWTVKNSNTTHNLKDVFYSSLRNFYVAVGDNNTLLQSVDLNIWNPITIPGGINDNFNAVYGQ